MVIRYIDRRIEEEYLALSDDRTVTSGHNYADTRVSV
jgi:hypothetical protein